MHIDFHENLEDYNTRKEKKSVRYDSRFGS